MKQKRIRWAALLAVLLAAVFVCMVFADRIQTANGTIEITEGVIPTTAGDLTYKLYTPKGATNAPGVLLLHGYQNDRETCAAYAIELARRGVKPPIGRERVLQLSLAIEQINGFVVRCNHNIAVGGDDGR